MTLKYNIERIQVSVELNKEQWNKLNDLDFLETVNPKLVKSGALDNTVEYSGHFGMAVYFTANNKSDANSATQSLSYLLNF